MINLTHMISILNSVFTVMFYVARWSKLDLTCICFKEFLNQLNLLYIYICNRTKYIEFWNRGYKLVIENTEAQTRNRKSPALGPLAAQRRAQVRCRLPKRARQKLLKGHGSAGSTPLPWRRGCRSASLPSLGFLRRARPAPSPATAAEAGETTEIGGPTSSSPSPVLTSAGPSAAVSWASSAHRYLLLPRLFPFPCSFEAQPTGFSLPSAREAANPVETAFT
jgi:hypothetical protein